MTTLQDTIRRSDRRDLAGRLIHRGGAGLCGGLAAAIVMLLIDRGTGLPIGLPAYVAVVLIGLAAGGLVALLRRPRPLTAARRLDAAFDLKDRLASAAALAAPDGAGGPRHDPAFAAMVQREADRVAGGLDVRAATPVRLSRTWGGALALAAVLLAGEWLLPAMPWTRPPAPAPPAPGVAADPQAQREELARSLEAAVEDLVPELAEDPDVLAEASDEVDALRALAEQLADSGDGDDPIDADTARDESAVRLQELADRLADQADAEAAAADELARRFAGMDRARDDLPLSMDEFLETLRRGEFGDAGDVLEQMLDDAESLGPEERRALGEALREMGRDVAGAEDAPPLEDDFPRNPEAQTDRLRELLREQGLDDAAIDELLADAAAEAGERPPLDETLDEQGVDEEVAAEIARELAERRERERVEEIAERDAERIADALDDAADALDPPPATPPTGAPNTDPPPAEPAAPRDSEAPREQPGAERTPQREGQPQGEQTGAERDPQREGQPQGEQTGAERDPQREGQPQGEQTGAERDPQREGQPQEQPPGAERDPQREGQPQDQPPGAERDPQREGQPQEQPGAERDPQREGQPQEQPGAERDPQREGQPQDQPPGAERDPQREGQPQEQQPGAERDPQREGQPQEQQPGAERDPQREGQPQDQPPDGQDPGDGDLARETETTDPSATPREQPGPGETLREVARRRDGAERKREASERIRETARRLAERMTPEERERWADQWRREPSDGAPGLDGRPDDDAPGAPEPLPATPDDVRLAEGDDPASDLLTEWRGADVPAEPGERVLTDGTSEDVARRLEGARRSAQRAIEESAVPARYHRFIKRYFDRLGQDGGPVAPAPAPPAPKNQAPPAGDGDDS